MTGISSDMITGLKRRGIDLDAIEQEEQEEREAGRREREAARKKAECLREERRRKERIEQGTKAIADGRAIVRIGDKQIRSAGDAVCPHCGAVPAGLLHLIEDVGRFVMSADIGAFGHYSAIKALHFSGSDRRWMGAPAINLALRCECGGEPFAVVIVLVPAFVRSV
ncbi:MAG: hypothetical protein KO254_04415 [Methanoculleus marisnigri]|nr:hypothetical protein [Methanoculleus marisnigri]